MSFKKEEENFQGTPLWVFVFFPLWGFEDFDEIFGVKMGVNINNLIIKLIFCCLILINKYLPKKNIFLKVYFFGFEAYLFSNMTLYISKWKYQ